jgi:predicted small integral membrane protein
MRAIRLCKTSLVASIALFFTLVAFGNLTDYGSNWEFVQHVLAMDTIFPNSSLHWRAIKSPSIQTAAYWAIIGWEIITAAVLWVGAARLLRAVPATHFAQAKTTAAVGLTFGLLLYVAGFVAVGGEWFAMWQSETWNGQEKAFGFIAMIAAVLIILLIPEAEER